MSQSLVCLCARPVQSRPDSVNMRTRLSLPRRACGVKVAACTPSVTSSTPSRIPATLWTPCTRNPSTVMTLSPSTGSALRSLISDLTHAVIGRSAYFQVTAVSGGSAHFPACFKIRGSYRNGFLKSCCGWNCETNVSPLCSSRHTYKHTF